MERSKRTFESSGLLPAEQYPESGEDTQLAQADRFRRRTRPAPEVDGGELLARLGVFSLRESVDWNVEDSDATGFPPLPRARAARGTHVGKPPFEKVETKVAVLSTAKSRRWRNPAIALSVAAALLALGVGGVAGYALWQRSSDGAPANAIVLASAPSPTASAVTQGTSEASLDAPPSTAIFAPTHRDDAADVELELEEHVVARAISEPRKSTPMPQAVVSAPVTASTRVEVAKPTANKVVGADKTLDGVAPRVSTDAPTMTLSKSIAAPSHEQIEAAATPAEGVALAMGAKAIPAAPKAKSIDDLIDEASPVAAQVEKQERSAPVKHGLDRGDIKQAFDKIRGRMLACATRHGGHGTARLRVTVGPDGRASNSRLSGGSFSAEFTQCAETAAEALRFPAFDGNPTSVTYPFLLAR